MYLANNNWDVPILSSVRDCILEICTPKSLCMPLHSIQTIIPKFVDSQVASKNKRKIQFFTVVTTNLLIFQHFDDKY